MRKTGLAILLVGQDRREEGLAQLTAPGQAAELIDHLRAAGITLTYDQDKRTLRTYAEDAVAVTVG